MFQLQKVASWFGAVAKQYSSLMRMASLVNERIFMCEPDTCPDSDQKNQKWNVYLQVNDGGKDMEMSSLWVPVHHGDGEYLSIMEMQETLEQKTKGR